MNHLAALLLRVIVAAAWRAPVHPRMGMSLGAQRHLSDAADWYDDA